MKFTFNLNMAIQILSTIGNGLTMASSVVPAEYKPIVLLSLGVVQAVSGLVAHFKNPDGTPASDSYQK